MVFILYISKNCKTQIFIKIDFKTVDLILALRLDPPHTKEPIH